MKRLWLIIVLFVLARPILAQTTSVTATLADSQSVAWASAPFKITWVGQGNPSTTSGQSFPLTVSGTANSSGVMTATVTDVAYIVPANSTWKVCVTSAVSAPSTYCTNIPITGTSENISTQINAVLVPPSVPGGPLASAYADSEVSAVNGNQYFRIGDGHFRCYANSAWSDCGSNAAGSAIWGQITGTLSNQTDLQTALNAKLPLAGGTMTGQIVTDGLGNDILVPAGGSIIITNDGVHPNSLSLPWQATANAAPTNATGLEGYVGSSGTSGWFDLPSALPSALSVMTFAGVASAHSVGNTKALAGTGTDIPTGPASSTNTDLVAYTGTGGQQADSGITTASVATLSATQTLTNKTLASAAIVTDGTYGSTAGITAGACETSYAATTVNTGSATTTTGQSCLPAAAIIIGVVYRITTTITTASSFTVGKTGSTSQFCSTQSTLTAGTTGTCSPSSFAYQSNATSVVVTFNTTPGAGAMRLITYYITMTSPPTS